MERKTPLLNLSPSLSLSSKFARLSEFRFFFYVILFFILRRISLTLSLFFLRLGNNKATLFFPFLLFRFFPFQRKEDLKKEVCRRCVNSDGKNRLMPGWSDIFRLKYRLALIFIRYLSWCNQGMHLLGFYFADAWEVLGSFTMMFCWVITGAFVECLHTKQSRTPLTILNFVVECKCIT